jgi:hypothetical protein
LLTGDLLSARAKVTFFAASSAALLAARSNALNVAKRARNASARDKSTRSSSGAKTLLLLLLKEANWLRRPEEE